MTSVKHPTGKPFRCLAPFLFSLLLAGCSSVSYKAVKAARPAEPPGYPIPVFTENMTVPRPCEIIGTASIGGSHFATFNGSAEGEMLKVLQIAHEKGADAIQIRSLQKPDFTIATYRLVVDLLRYTDTWETVPVSEKGFVQYLETNQRNLDPIEGVWDTFGPVPHSVGIMRDASKPGRDFVAFILTTANPAWRSGYKKMDIRRGPQPGTYQLSYYLDNFSKRETTVILGRRMTFTLAIPRQNDDGAFVIYSKNRQVP